MELVFVFALFIVSAIAVPTVPCTISSQFQASMRQLMLTDGGCLLSMSVGSMYYDYINSNLRVDVTVYSQSGYSQYLSIWYFYSDFGNTQYLLDRSTNICSKQSFQGPMPPPTIPTNSNFDSQGLIGGQAIDTWNLYTQSSDPHFMGTISVTSDTCFVVVEHRFNITTGSLASSSNYLNFIPSVPTYIFDLPTECVNDNLKPINRQFSDKSFRFPFDF